MGATANTNAANASVSYRGFMFASHASGAGKTVISLGAMRALADRGIDFAPAKVGPDYIDPTFHTVAARRPSVNLDPWAMRPETHASLAAGPRPLVVEAAMGLFDGAADGSATADALARELGLATILVVDCARAGASAAATLRGFVTHHQPSTIRGVILNGIASERHERIVRRTAEAVCREFGVALLGVVYRDPSLAVPSRHLGLVPAGEHEAIEIFVSQASRIIAESVDLEHALGWCSCHSVDERQPSETLPPLGQHIAVASDVAFAFAYPHLLQGWHDAGAKITQFSPLANEAPPNDADAIFLPGGYPELHAATLSAAERFRDGVHAAASKGTTIYGECGGYMALGTGLADTHGERHVMLGLLPVETSFAERKLHLGYRQVRTHSGAPSFLGNGTFRGHEFHHATVVSEGACGPLFDAWDAEGVALGPVGLRQGSVMGSFMHLIDRT